MRRLSTRTGLTRGILMSIGLVVGSIVLGRLLAMGDTRPIFLLIAGVIALALLLNKELFVFSAVVVSVAVPTDWISGTLVGIPQVSLTRLLVLIGVIHVVRIALVRDRSVGLRSGPFDVPVLAYGVVSTVGMVMRPEMALHMWDHVIFAPVMLYIVFRVISSESAVERTFSIAVITGGAILSLSVILDQMAGVPLFANPFRPYDWMETPGTVFRPGGTLGQPVRAATLCVLLLTWYPFALFKLGRSRRWLLWLALLLLAIGLTFTRAAWLSLVLVLPVYLLLMYGGRALAIALPFAGAVSAWAISSLEGTRLTQAVLRPETLQYRMGLWGYAWGVFRNQSLPEALLGGGMLVTRDPNYSAAFTLARSGTHNAYLTMFLEHGVVGVVSFMGVLASAIFAGFRAISQRDSLAHSAGLVLIGITIVLAVTSFTSEIVRQYNVVSFTLISLAVLTTAVRDTEAEVSNEDRALQF